MSTPHLPLRFTRRAAIGSAAALGISAPALRAAAQSADTEIGLPDPAEPAFEFVGRIDQRGPEFTIYGYLSHADGLGQAELFANDDPMARTEASARLTFHGVAFLSARSILDNLFSVTSDGEIRFYASDDPGAAFADPDSFATGAEIGIAALRIRTVVNVQAPLSGIASGHGWLRLTSATPFTLLDQDLVLGGIDTRHTLTLTGQGTLEDPEEPRSFILMSGGIFPTATPV